MEYRWQRELAASKLAETAEAEMETNSLVDALVHGGELLNEVSPPAPNGIVFENSR